MCKENLQKKCQISHFVSSKNIGKKKQNFRRFYTRFRDLFFIICFVQILTRKVRIFFSKVLFYCHFCYCFFLIFVKFCHEACILVFLQLSYFLFFCWEILKFFSFITNLCQKSLKKMFFFKWNNYFHNYIFWYCQFFLFSSNLFIFQFFSNFVIKFLLFFSRML